MSEETETEQGWRVARAFSDYFLKRNEDVQMMPFAERLADTRHLPCPRCPNHYDNSRPNLFDTGYNSVGICDDCVEDIEKTTKEVLEALACP